MFHRCNFCVYCFGILAFDCKNLHIENVRCFSIKALLFRLLLFLGRGWNERRNKHFLCIAERKSLEPMKKKNNGATSCRVSVNCEWRSMPVEIARKPKTSAINLNYKHWFIYSTQSMCIIKCNRIECATYWHRTYSSCDRYCWSDCSVWHATFLH